MSRSCQNKASLVTFVAGSFMLILSVVFTCSDNQCISSRQNTPSPPIIDEQTDRAVGGGFFLTSILLFCISVCLSPPRTTPSRLRSPSSGSEEEGRQLITSSLASSEAP